MDEKTENYLDYCNLSLTSNAKDIELFIINELKGVNNLYLVKVWKGLERYVEVRKEELENEK